MATPPNPNPNIEHETHLINSSLEAFKSGAQLPDNLWAKVARVQSMGALRVLNDR